MVLLKPYREMLWVAEEMQAMWGREQENREGTLFSHFSEAHIICNFCILCEALPFSCPYLQSASLCELWLLRSSFSLLAKWL